MRNKWLSGLVGLGLIGLCGCFFFFSGEIFSGIANGISICLNTLIPSMFAFMVLAEFIGSSGYGRVLCKPFGWLARWVFHVDGELFSVFLLSMLGGYPVGARMLAVKLERREISKETAEFMLRFCVNCSPAFLIGGVSQVLWHTGEVGLLLYAAQGLAALTIAFVSGLGRKVCVCRRPANQEKENGSVVFVRSVGQASKAMGMICSFVVLFCGVFALIDLLGLQGGNGVVIKGLLEVTSGCQMLGGMPFMQSVLLAALFTSFGGVCVLMQVMALLNGTGVRFGRFLLWRGVYTALSVGFSFLGMHWLKPVISCFGTSGNCVVEPYSVSPISSVLLLLLGILLLCFWKKPATIELTHRREDSAP